MKNLFPSFTKREIKNMGDDIQNVVFVLSLKSVQKRMFVDF